MKNIKPNGLVYITNYDQLHEFKTENGFYENKAFNENFSYNKDLSDIARTGEGIWTPGIIQKKSKVKKIASKYHKKKNSKEIEIEIDDEDIFCQYQ